MRLDQFLVQAKIMRSRSQAQDFIKKSWVEVLIDSEFKVVTKASYSCDANTKVRIKNESLADWVSRSGEKLECAIKKLNLSFEGMVVLDLGQSTGGFSQSALKNGASQVIGVDVGKDQLHKSIKEDPRVESYESTDARDLGFLSERNIDFIVADLSFISVLQVFSDLKVKSKEALVLIKPQFELGREEVRKGAGLILDPQQHLDCQRKVFSSITDYEIKDYFPSELRGKDGNQEFFAYMHLK